MAMLTDSSSVTRSSGVTGATPRSTPITGSGSQGPTYCSRRFRAEPMWSRQIRASAVVNQPRVSRMSEVSTRANRR